MSGRALAGVRAALDLGWRKRLARRIRQAIATAMPRPAFAGA